MEEIAGIQAGINAPDTLNMTSVRKLHLHILFAVCSVFLLDTLCHHPNIVFLQLGSRVAVRYISSPTSLGLEQDVDCRI